MFANQRVERVACEPMRAAVLVLMVGIAALAWIAPASANAKAHTRVTLDFITLDPDDGGGPGPSKASGSKGSTYYVGRIFSKKKACKDHRHVVVYRARPGADQKRVGAYTHRRKDPSTGDFGYFWKAHERVLVPVTDKYYAKVRPTAQCAGDRSENWAFPPA